MANVTPNATGKVTEESNKDNPDFKKKYDYVPVGANQKEDKRTCDKILLEYDRYINEKDFIGWPLSNRIGGFHVEEKTLRYTPEPYPNYITELLVSNLDVHPNGKGQEKIAEFLYDRLGQRILSKQRRIFKNL